MDKILEFCGQNWTYLVAVLLAVVEIFILFVRTKKSRQFLLSDLTSNLPTFICEAEVKCESGEEKLKYVLTRAIEWLHVETGISPIRLMRLFSDKIVSATESILATPQKKGE